MKITLTLTREEVLGAVEHWLEDQYAHSLDLKKDYECNFQYNGEYVDLNKLVISQTED